MKKWNVALLAVLSMVFASPVLAHEGHEIPGSVKSIYGGVVKTGKVAHLEYVISGTELKIYARAHEGEELPADFSVTAKAIPKKGAAYDLPLVKKDKFYSANIDLKGANRLPVQLTFKNGKLADNFKIQVEAE